MRMIFKPLCCRVLLVLNCVASIPSNISIGIGHYFLCFCYIIGRDSGTYRAVWPVRLLCVLQLGCAGGVGRARQCPVCTVTCNIPGVCAAQVHGSALLCELCCSPLQPAGVLAHLQRHHTGCGGPSAGRGYQASGRYGELAVSAAEPCGAAAAGLYYLLCADCRQRYMAAAAAARSDTPAAHRGAIRDTSQRGTVSRVSQCGWRH